MNTFLKLELLIEKAKSDFNLRQNLLNTKNSSDPMENFCKIARENGVEIYVGDLFAAVLTGALAKGRDMETAVKKAADFVKKAVARTNALHTDSRCGVQFESVLHLLSQD